MVEQLFILKQNTKCSKFHILQSTQMDEGLNVKYKVIKTLEKSKGDQEIG